MILKRDFLAGLFFMAIGLGFFVAASRYSLGSASRMGPGYFPSALSAFLFIIGLLVAARALMSSQTAPPSEGGAFSFKSAAIILGSTLLFAVMLAYAGLIVAVIVLVVVSSGAVGRSLKWQTWILAILLAAFSALLFVALLGLPVPLWPTN